MPNTAMLESSMFLHRDSANYLLALAKNGLLENMYVSARLMDMENAKAKYVRLFGKYLEIPTRQIDLNTFQQLIYEIKHNDSIYKYTHKIDNINHVNFHKYIKDEFIAQIIYEEWEFLTTNSWLFSKTRKIFDEMVNLGGTAVHISQEQFDKFIRLSLKKSDDQPITPNDRVRAAAKWVAIGGPAILGVINPVAGALSSTVSGIFLLCDP